LGRRGLVFKLDFATLLTTKVGVCVPQSPTQEIEKPPPSEPVSIGSPVRFGSHGDPEDPVRLLREKPK